MLPWAVRDLKKRRDRRLDALPRHHRGGRPRRDRLYLVRAARAAHAREHGVQAAALRLCVRILKCKVVGLRTDNFNFRSQRAIEALGAKKDIRHHWPRRDGTIRDTVMYSVLAREWPDVKRHLEFRLNRNETD